MFACELLRERKHRTPAAAKAGITTGGHPVHMMFAVLTTMEAGVK